MCLYFHFNDTDQSFQNRYEKRYEIAIRAFHFSLLPPAAAGRSGGCEDTSRSGKGLATLCNPHFGERWKALK